MSGRAVLAHVGAFVTALGCAMGADALGSGRIYGFGVAIALATLLGALQAALWPLLVTKHGTAKRAATGAILAFTASIVVGRTNFGWIDIGPLGAGAPGELALVLFPCVSALAMAGALAITPRVASRR